MVCHGSAVAATVAAMEAATEQIRMEMHGIMNVAGKGGLRFGAMEALATTDGRGKRVQQQPQATIQPVISQPITIVLDGACWSSFFRCAGQERGGWHAMIVDCDRKRDHTPITCGVIDRVTDPGVGGVQIITYDLFVVASNS